MRFRKQLSILLSRQWMIQLLLLSTPSTWCIASQPNFLWPENTIQERQDALQQAFKDAVLLARVVAVTFDSCEEVSELESYLNNPRCC